MHDVDNDDNNDNDGDDGDDDDNNNNNDDDKNEYSNEDLVHRSCDRQIMHKISIIKVWL
jgi:hypothetical protein